MVQKPEFDPNKAIETGDLTPIVRRIVDSPRAEVAGVWKAEKIGRSAGFGTVGIFRVAGEAITPEGKRSWSVVLKVLDESVGGVGGDFNTPALELAAYRSGLFEQSPDAAGFRSSTCYAIDVKADGSHWLWIEDLSGSPVPPWPDALYVSVARHVGQFNGEWATRGSDYPAFLKKGGYWHGLPRNGPSEAFQRVLIARDNPLVRRCLPPDMIERASRLGQEAFYCYQKLDQFPVTICHTDCHPKNLFPLVNHGRHTATVAVDWGSVSLGPAGVDAGPLLGSGAGWTETDAAHLKRLTEPVFESYLQGLRDAGWSGDPRQARLGYLTSLAGDYGGRMVFFTDRFVTDEKFRAKFTALFGRSTEFLLDSWQSCLRVMLPMMDEAMTLARSL